MSSSPVDLTPTTLETPLGTFEKYDENQSSKTPENESAKHRESKLSPEEQKLKEQLDALKDLEGHESAFKESENAQLPQMPDIDPSDLQIPFNPIFNETFDMMPCVWNILKVFAGRGSFQYKMLAPTMGILGSVLGWINQDVVPKAVGLGGAIGSGFFTLYEAKNLVLDSKKYKTNIDWLAHKTASAAKVALGAYSFLSSAYMLNLTPSQDGFGYEEDPNANLMTFGLLLTGVSLGAGLYSLYTSDDQETKVPEESKTTSTLSWLGSLAKKTTIACGAIAGIGATLGFYAPGVRTAADLLYQSISYASHGGFFLRGATDLLGQRPIQLVIGLASLIGTQMITWKLWGDMFQKLGKEVEAITENMKYSPYLEQLESLSQEEYRTLITEETGMEFEGIQGAFEPLKERNAEFPENAAKPVIAKIMVVNKEIYGSDGVMEQYVKCIQENNLEEATALLNKELRPKLMMLVYLKHCLLSPTRPQFGALIGQPGSQEYFSHVSHLWGAPIKLPLEQVEPGKIQEETHQILMQENQMQQQFYVVQAMQKKQKQQQAELLAQQILNGKFAKNQAEETKPQQVVSE